MDTERPALKELLSGFRAVRGLRIDPERSKCLAARVGLEARWHAVETRKPTLVELAAVHAEVVAHWQRDPSIERMRPLHRRWIPWILFDSPAPGRPPLAADRPLVGAYLTWLVNRPRASAIVAMVRVILEKYPKTTPIFSELLRGIREAVMRSSGLPRVTVWRNRVVEFGLLEDNGAATFAQRVYGGEGTPEELFSRAGLTPELSRSAFLRETVDGLLTIASTKLLERSLASARLEQILTALTDGQDRLRFPERRGETAEALLGSLVAQDPEADVRALLQRFFLTTYGDPRVAGSAAWQAVKAPTREVMFRWLVSATIEDFFALISKTADAVPWRYRQAFWRAYLGRGWIDQAWAVLGRDVWTAARGALRGRGACGRLTGASERNHSVLLLKIGSVIIAEWSHNGKCRMWSDQHSMAPKFYRTEYDSDDLRKGAQFEQPHYGSEYGVWQRAVVEHIRRVTDRRVNRSEYMPREVG